MCWSWRVEIEAQAEREIGGERGISTGAAGGKGNMAMRGTDGEMRSLYIEELGEPALVLLR